MLMVTEEVEDTVITLVRVGVIAAHSCEIIGWSIGTTVAAVLIFEELVDMYGDYRLRKRVRAERHVVHHAHHKKVSHHYHGAR